MESFHPPCPPPQGFFLFADVLSYENMPDASEMSIVCFPVSFRIVDASLQKQFGFLFCFEGCIASTISNSSFAAVTTQCLSPSHLHILIPDKPLPTLQGGEVVLAL